MSENPKHVISPPMGWNTWDCYGSRVTENEVRANAEYMSTHLRPSGWEYIVIDINWYEPTKSLFDPFPEGIRDEFGRYLPAVNRFPSAAGGAGFRPLAEYLHRLGLKFGLHIMRGVPRKAVESREPIQGTPYTADQIADRDSICTWNQNNYGVDISKPGGQEYYDSLLDLYASWGVDFIKADNMVRQEEIEAVVRAIDKAERTFVLSLVSVSESGVLRHPRAVMYRISNDVWDEWQDPNTPWCGVNDMFELCSRHAPLIADGCFPDCDMLPIGRIGKNDAVGEDRATLLTPDEQITLMTLWSIFRSPLMFGGSLVEMDDFTLSLLTNPEVLAVNQRSTRNRPLFTDSHRAAWAAEDRDNCDAYLALFNRSDSPIAVGANLSELGLDSEAAVRDLWLRKDSGVCRGNIERVLPPHAAALLRLSSQAQVQKRTT